MFAAFVLIFGIGAAAHANDRVINDELVSGLRCSTLSVDSVYKSIRPEAFDTIRRIDTNNGEAHTELKSFGDCWSLSHWQRLALLLGRQDALDLPLSIRVISDLIRGTVPATEMTVLPGVVSARAVEKTMTAYRVFRLPEVVEASFDERLRAMYEKDSSLSSHRGYLQDIHAYQFSKFYRLSNLSYVFETRPPLESARDLARAADLAKTRRLPMLLLRLSRTAQHVVLLDRVTKLDANAWTFHLIDSNYGRYDMSQLEVSRDAEGHWKFDFNRPGFDAFSETGTSHVLLESVHLIGEDERPKIDQALLGRYRILCR